MRTSKLVIMVMIGLALLELSFGQPLRATSPTGVGTPRITVSQVSVQDQETNISMQGVASIYADLFNGRKTASGQPFSQGRFTAAHRFLPLGTTVRVTNLRNSRSVEVRINDRGPWCKGRIIDLSKAAAKRLGMVRAGLALVRLEIIDGLSTGKS